MFKARCIQHRFTIAVFVFLICYFIYSINRAYGFTFFPDEFGYWTYAALSAGYDWANITALGSYYSYGYSLILFPIFYFIKDAVLAYRVAVAVNFVLLGMTFWFLMLLQKQMTFEASEETSIFTAIAVFYPAWLFYARSTMVETVLMTLFVVICLLMYQYLENNRLSKLVLLIVALVYIHFLHMRAIGVLVAGIITLICDFVSRAFEKNKTKQKKNKHWLIFIALALAALAVGFFVKQQIEIHIYGGASNGTFAVNDYAGQFEKISYLFTRTGIENFICGLAGKILYIGCATFGLAIWGIVYTVRELFDKSASKSQRLFALFVLLSTIAELMINVIYNIRPLRVDSVTYGRYHEFVFPVLMILGLMEMKRITDKWLVCTTGIILLGEVPLVMLALRGIEKYNLTNIHGYVMVGMGYLYDTSDYTPSKLYWQTYAVAAVITISTVIIMLLYKNFGENLLFLWIAVIIIELAISMRASELYIEPSAKGAFRDTYVVEKIENIKDIYSEDKDRRIVYVSESEDSLISILQFMLRDEKINILYKNADNPLTESLRETDIVVLDYRSEVGNQLEEMYGEMFANGHFILYYNY